MSADVLSVCGSDAAHEAEREGDLSALRIAASGSETDSRTEAMMWNVIEGEVFDA